MRKFIHCAVGSIALVLFTAGLSLAEDGATIYTQNCAMCHDGGNDRAPSRETLRQMSPERVLAALESGAMISMANRRSPAERRALAEFVTGKSFSQPLDTTPASKALCTAAPGGFANPLAGPVWNGWGVTTSNTRYQGAAGAGLSAASVPRLKVKWAFGFPGDLSANAQPVVAGGRVFVGSPSGLVYSLSAATGCVHWYFQAASAVRAAVTIARIQTGSVQRYAAFFGDLAANVYAVDAGTGQLLWKTRIDNYPLARATGSVVFYNGRLYVGVASGEEIASVPADYECCRFRGSLVALNAATGDQVWRTYTITEEAQPTKKNKAGTQMWGPSGAPIWTSPAIDPQRNVIYVTTGDNYSDPPTANSDAFMALDRDTGKILWSRQMTAADAYNSACRMPDKANCPDSNGPDLDFASAPILVTLSNGRRALVAGQKSGVVHAVDPDREGAVLWSTRIGKGGTLGGIQWGSAADQSNIYVALSDIGRISLSYSTSSDADPKSGGGMFALRLDNGERVWYTPPPECGDKKRCSPAQSAAVSAIPGVAFSGSEDGHFRAYSTTKGAVIWDFDTIRSYETVNGVPARGGSLDGPGAAIAGGMLFVNSGYAGSGGMPGNVLLGFSVDGK
ncbi:MAG TPA: PQQ-binding-like beta-propeller repeat protein [Terriglobia bacterium]|nr:PQQ-binding-like beta-propeller repeat protein [Terriglobia bacterium]